jgi:hypothetical protein
MAPAAANAARQTVCTITVNSSDEKDAFMRHLPADRYSFVELVERGRPDWLQSARRKGIRCDVLIISGHYDGGDYAGGNEFFSEHVESREFLPVDEMERAACSEPDQGLFSQLKEVYLFGCNTLNPEALRSGAEELRRSLIESGHSPAEAERLAHALGVRYADSSRDRMRHIFRNVPAIYGFSSVAPLGPVAATYLDRYFRGGGASEIGTGRGGGKLLGYFPGRSLTLARGVRDGDADAELRRDVCQFVDDRLTPAQKVEWVHRLLTRDMAEVRIFLDRLERFGASLDEGVRRSPDVAAALDAIARDVDARERYLRFVRASDRPAVRARLIEVAADFGWLSSVERRDELANMIVELVGQSAVSAADVDLVCRLNHDRALDEALDRLPGRANPDIGRAAIRACLGSFSDEAPVVHALVSERDGDVQIAQVYLRHHPIRDVGEVREIASGIATMTDPIAQTRALDTLAHLRVQDRATLDLLTALFPNVTSVNVQRAIAGVLIRADFEQIASPDLVRALREHRLKSPDGRDLIDVLIRRLDVPDRRSS